MNSIKYRFASRAQLLNRDYDFPKICYSPRPFYQVLGRDWGVRCMPDMMIAARLSSLSPVEAWVVDLGVDLAEDSAVVVAEEAEAAAEEVVDTAVAEDSEAAVVLAAVQATVVPRVATAVAELAADPVLAMVAALEVVSAEASEVA